MLTLTAERTEKIRRYELASFKEYCEVHGFDEKQYAHQLLLSGRERLEVAFAGIPLDRLPDDFVKNVERIRLSENFLEGIEIENQMRRVGFASLITELSDHLPIRFEYVRSLGAQLGLNGHLEQKEILHQLLEAIPLISSWQLEFNAFVTGASTVDGLPCVCIYETLHSAMHGFITNTILAAFEFTPSANKFFPAAKLRDLQEAEREGSDPKIDMAISSCLEFSLGGKTAAWEVDHSDDPALYRIALVMLNGGTKMVWFHEYGHLLQGHLEDAQSHQVEFEADRFAFDILAKNCNTYGGQLEYLGGLTTLVLLDILETIRAQPEAMSHPSAKRRIVAVLKSLYAVDVDFTLIAHKYIRVLAAACKRSLVRNWDVEINY